ncbi:MAG: VOC family protein [Sporichthyaceae bacterium]
MVNPIPAGYPRVIPYLNVDGAAAAIEWYVSVFGGKERMRMAMPGGKVGHAEIEFGESLVMLADANPEWGNREPKDIGGTPVTVMMYVEDVDALYAAAVAAGATSEMEPKDQFYGDRSAAFVDPWGHRWHIASHVEDVSEEEMGRRMAEMTGG